MTRSVVRPLLIIVAVLVLLAAAAGGFIWWKVSSLKETLVAGLGRALNAQVEVASLDLDIWKGELHAAGIRLTNNRPEAPWEKGAIGQATVRFHLRDLFSPSMPLEVDVSDWDLTLHSYTSSSTPPDTTSLATAPGQEPSPAGRRLKVTSINAHDGTVEINLAGGRHVTIRGVTFQAADNGAGQWNTDLQVSSIASGTFETGTGSVQIRGEDDKVTFSNLRLACGEGQLSGDGTVALPAPHTCHALLKATDLPVTMLVAAAWQMKLSGFVSGDLTFDGDDRDASATGHLAVAHSRINVLPLLGKATTLVGLPDISNIELDKTTCDFQWKDGLLHLTNIDIRKNDITRITGSVDLNALGMIDGKLKLGLPTAAIAKWPQLQEKVFSVQSEDFSWADVHLTGTPDSLHEDLSPRLVDVGIQSGSDVIQQATKKASDLLNNFLGQ